MLNRGLASFVAPQSLEDFLQGPWPKKPFVAHGLSTSVAALTEIPMLRSLDALLAAWRGTVQVHLPDVRDESHAIDTSTADARKLFANGMALLFNNVHGASPVLVDWLRAIAADLGLPNSTHARCMVYATPDGKGTAAHFDQNINFVLQLHGTKKWKIAPNANVENPTQRHTLGQAVDPELAGYLEAELPSVMPIEGAQEIVLRPGSMLFVPRGYWHSTSAEGEALALNFTYSQPTWIDLFTLALRSRLAMSPVWRELADGVTSTNEERREEARETLDALLAGLVEDLPNWRAEDILGATEGTFS